MDLATLYWAQHARRAIREQFGHEATSERMVRPAHPVRDDRRTGRRIVRRSG